VLFWSAAIRIASARKVLPLHDRKPSAALVALRAISDPIRYDAAGRRDGSGQESAGAGSKVDG
jgi:hypothetical protein